jgi:hypothetical protein
MTEQAQTALGLVEIEGPPSSHLPGAEPLWRVAAFAPKFGLPRVKNKPAVQEDRIHPVRTLLLGEEETCPDGSRWRTPRLLSLHVVMGPDGNDSFASEECLYLNVAAEGGGTGTSAKIVAFTPAENGSHTPAVYRAKTVAVGDASTARAFHHIVAAPILDGREWPVEHGQINVPRLRLVEGAIELLVVKTELEKLKPFQAIAVEIFSKEAKKNSVRIRLTADGIEIRAKAPFPCKGEDWADLLAVPGPRGGIVFRLLPRQERPFWVNAWRTVTPASDSQEEALAGFKIDARRDDRPPAFEWRPQVGSKVAGLTQEIFVPGADLGVRLVSPSGDGVDGVAALAPAYYRLAASRAAGLSQLADRFANGLILLSAELSRPPPPSASLAGPAIGASAAQTPDAALEAGLRLSSVPEEGLPFEAKLVAAKGSSGVDHACGYDDVLLAATLRAAQGAPDPRFLGKTEDSPEKPASGLAPLSGYVPLDEGWLQFPILNRPAPDPAKDSELVNLPPFTPPNVLSGFVRFAQMGKRPALLSAASGTHVEIDEAPWTVSVLGAEAARLEIVLDPAAGQAGPLEQAVVHLAQPRLSTRGLIWLSSDRPNAREALPRLSAGPTAFVEIPLESKGIKEDGLAIGLTALKIRSGKLASSLVRDALGISIAPGSDAPKGGRWPEIGDKAVPVLWTRHPNMPLAAAMPMTRSARSSTYPLESRDLVPFSVEPDAVWFRLTWNARSVFPQASANNGKPLKLWVHEQWPWPTAGKPLASAAQRNAFAGIGLLAFGVPGWELRFDRGANGNDVWLSLRSSMRFDIPGQDEAFASEAAPLAPGEAPPPVTVATSLNWDGLAAHWSEQDRRVSIARVVASRADGMTSDLILAKGATAPEAAVTTLIGDATWRTKLGFARPDGTEDLPYGVATVGSKTYQGDDALLGLSGPVKVELKTGGAASYELIGFSPTMVPEGDWQVDNRRLGLKPLAQSGTLRWRAVRSVVSDPQPIAGLATLEQPIDITWAPGGQKAFCFWMKDTGFDKAGIAAGPGKAADFDAWLDTRLARGSAEWRIYPHDATDQAERFLEGRERIAFFGLELEPLQLVRMTAKMAGGSATGLETIVVRCRVHLGRETPGAENSNLVELVLTAEGDAWRATVAKTSLRFFFPEAADETMLRLDTSLSLAAGKPPVFEDSFVQISTAAMALGDKAAVSTDGTKISIAVAEKKEKALPPPSDGDASIALVGLAATVSAKQAMVLRFKRRLTVSPVQAAGKGAPVFVADFDNRDLTVATLLRVKIDANSKLEEYDGAIGLALKGPMDGILASRLKGQVSLALAGTLPGADPKKNASASILFEAGLLDGTFVCDEPKAGEPDPAAAKAADDPHGLAIRRFWLRVARKTRGALKPSAQWTGGIELFGSIDISNAIAWPALTAPAPADRNIPFPDGRSGRLKIVVDQSEAGKPTLHRVRYTLDGHRLDLGLAGRIARLDDDAIWTTVVVGEHHLGGEPALAKVVAAETIALGAANALIPPVMDIAKDAKSFAGRYRDKIDANGDEESGKPAPGMDATGIGRIATVFRGALGLPFRAAFHAKPETGLFVAGGAVGLAERAGLAPELVRLPVLAGLKGDTLFRNGHIAQRGDARIDVAWNDGHARLPVHAAGRLATTPASWSQRALEAALIAGSVTRWSQLPAAGDPLLAVLVEQYFSSAPMSSDALKAGDLTGTPFFIGAAVTVHRLIERPSDKPVKFVSFLAAPLEVLAGGKPPSKPIASLATAIRISSSGKIDAALPERAPMLASIGDDLVESPWQGADAIAPQDVAIEAIRRPAFTEHAAPRVALLRVKGEGGLSRYRPIDIPRRAKRARWQGNAETVQPDSARGFPLAVVPPGGWLLGSEESIGIPIRDDTPSGGLPASGVAGLSRRISLPAEADAHRTSPYNPTWYVQTRAPVYHSLGLTGISCEPVPWLRPSPARPRLPTYGAISEAWLSAQLGDVQAIIPEQMSITSGGDRAGILTVRATHLETPVPIEGLEFDPAARHYGQPAQAGPFLPKTDRTPRPGPIPTNGPEAYRRRRPCASPLFATRPLDLVRGTADMLRGEEEGGWSATLVAASEWNGIVTDKWDGTIGLSIEINVATKKDGGGAHGAAVKPALLLGKLLGAKGETSQARARLLIGGVAVDYRFAMLRGKIPDPISLNADGKETKAAAEIVAWRQRFSMILDPSETGDRHVELDAIGKAMNLGETLPLVELTLALQAPDPNYGEEVKEARYALHLDRTDDKIALPSGEISPPTTLKFELFPLLPRRGALPLAPASVMFSDQSYDEGLASVPLTTAIQAIAEPASDLPGDRGELQLIFAAERASAQLGGTLAVMLDLAFERRLDPIVRATAAGDMISIGNLTATLTLAVQPADGEQRTVFVGTPMDSDGTAYTPPKQPTVRLGHVHELDLSRLVEANGRAADLKTGDMLVLRVGTVGPPFPQDLEFPKLFKATGGELQLTALETQKGLDLRVQLTATPVVEPPPSTYVAMMRRVVPDATQKKTVSQLSLPLYALSPLPRRIGMIDARAGFRTGLIKRYATFVWTLMRPRSELEGTGLAVHIVKEERSGQSHRPSTIEEMVEPRSLAYERQGTEQYSDGRTTAKTVRSAVSGPDG